MKAIKYLLLATLLIPVQIAAQDNVDAPEPIGSDRFGGSALVGYDKPLLVMTWGESYHYQPPTP